jgi:hypothetical protein
MSIRIMRGIIENCSIGKHNIGTALFSGGRQLALDNILRLHGIIAGNPAGFHLVKRVYQDERLGKIGAGRGANDHMALAIDV